MIPYKEDIEPNVITKKEIIEGIKKLSSIVGIDNLWVRYDPVFLSDKYDIDYHKRAFERMCCLLKGYVKKIIVSFIDDYKNVRKNVDILRNREFTEDDYREIGLSFSASASRNNMTVQTCFEERNLNEYGFIIGDCASSELVFRLTGKVYGKWKARKEKKCNCVDMVDIGVYNSCKRFCKYCYANYDENMVKYNYSKHDLGSSLLIGKIERDDVVKERFK